MHQKNHKTILSVSHVADKGKTETLRELADLLLQTFPSYTLVQEASAIVPRTGDFRIIININGRIVAVESQGDPNTQLGSRLIDLADNFHADLIFCSTRTKNDTVKAVEHLESTRNYEAIWTSTYQIKTNHRLVNALKAKHILDLICSLKIL